MTPKALFAQKKTWIYLQVLIAGDVFIPTTC